MAIAVSVMVITDEEATAVRVGEVLNRACVGLSLEGLAVSLSYTSVPDDKDEDDPLGGHPDPRYEM